MNILDILIIILAISSLFRGFDIGLVRQFFSTAGFISGLFLGAWLEQYTVKLVHTPLSRSVVTVATTLGMAFIFLAIGEGIGDRLKSRIQLRSIFDRFDKFFGSIIGVVTVAISIWLGSSVLSTFPSPVVQDQIKGSTILSYLNKSLPEAPSVIAKLGSLIDPNGFPKVFTGDEPVQEGNTQIPGISPQLQAAINAAKVSTVKVEGLGCGGVVDGSGFVISSNLVVTNAHVVAGVRQPYVKDANGQHSTTPVWFDPDLDLAILRVPNLAGPALTVSTSTVPRNTLGAVLGYPGGGPLTAGGASVLDEFTARGRNIYGTDTTQRDVYSLAAKVIPGNSGGPVISSDGTVIGVVFATSTTYNNVGYALSTPQILPAISQAQAQNRAVGTGSCAE